MSSKEDILKKYRANIREQFDMPDLSDIQAITYPDPLLQFMNMTKSVGGNSIEVDAGRDINELIRELYPDAKEIASNLPEITIATRNPDEVGRARDLNGTDVGIIRGKFGVAENGCVWIPQQMKEKAVCFISEKLTAALSSTTTATARSSAVPQRLPTLPKYWSWVPRLHALRPSCYCRNNAAIAGLLTAKPLQ